MVIFYKKLRINIEPVLKKGRRRLIDMKHKKGNVVRYNRWGYFFLIPFIVVYLIFQLVPLFRTIYNSFFENYLANGGITQVGPNYIGLENYSKLFSQGDIWIYLKNTMI